MRVVGGACKGRRLVSFKGLRIRPTSDKVREAVFNILSEGFPARFIKALDLFAGTGAMGIEALSRGSKEVVFIDNDPKSAEVIEKNLSLCGLTDSARVYKRDALTAISILSNRGERFDLIIIDPPYDSTLTTDALKSIEEKGILNPGGVIVAEASKRAHLEFVTEGLSLFDERRYGDTVIYLFTSGTGSALDS